MKKLLSILLACVMLLGLVAPVFAEDNEQPATDPAPVTDPADDPIEDPVETTDPADDPSEDPSADPADDPVAPEEPAKEPEKEPLAAGDEESLGNNRMAEQTAVDLANGFYLNRQSKNWIPQAADKLEANPNADDEYLLITNLTEGDHFKAVYVSNGQFGDENWYPGGTDNDYVVTSGVPQNNVTVYFRPNNQYDSTFTVLQNYQVSIADGIMNGTVTVNPESACKETTVTLTITPDGGYALDMLSVIGDFSGEPVSVTDNKFSMPEENVTVYASFLPMVDGTHFAQWYVGSDNVLHIGVGLTVPSDALGSGTLSMTSGYGTSSATYTPYYSLKSSITSVQIDSAVAPTNMAYWFFGLNSTTSIDLTNLNASNVRSMEGLFYGCRAMTSLIFGDNFDTGSVTNMESMFTSCHGLAALDLSGLDTRNVTNMKNMFCGCYAELTFGGSFDTGNVTNMYQMFYSCRATTLDLSSFHTGKVTDMGGMFADCYFLTSLTFGENFDTSNVTRMSGMFFECEKLQSVDISMFNTGKVTNMSEMFEQSGLVSLDLRNFDTSNVTTMYCMFYICRSLQSVDLSSFNTSKVTNFGRMFNTCTELQSLDVTNFNTSSATDINTMFSNCWLLTTLDVTRFNTSKVTDMHELFCDCKALASIDVRSFNTAKVKKMNGMFSGCESLTSLDVSSFNTAAVTDMSSMFYNCKGLTTLDLSNFNTQSVTNMYRMFGSCSGLTTLTFGANFKTSKVTDMRGMFIDCAGFETIDLSRFDTSMVTSMTEMFRGCTNLKTLDLSTFNMASVTSTLSMFADCGKLHTIYVSPNWSIAHLNLGNAANTFSYCKSLVGGAGTVCDGARTGSTVGRNMAVIDSEETPGYLTAIADKGNETIVTSSESDPKEFKTAIEKLENGVVQVTLPVNHYPRWAADNAPALKDPEYANYIFWGYSSGETPDTNESGRTNATYALFLPGKVLDVYLQFRHTSRAATDPENKTDLRFLTSVPDPDTLGYNGALVGFKLLNVTDGFQISNHAFGTQYCYDEITGNYKVQDDQGNVFSLTPDRFYQGISAKVALQTIIGMPNTYFDNQKVLSVQPYIITLDGTYSYAKVHTFRLKYASDGSKTAVPVA